MHDIAIDGADGAVAAETTDAGVQNVGLVGMSGTHALHTSGDGSGILAPWPAVAHFRLRRTKSSVWRRCSPEWLP